VITQTLKFDLSLPVSTRKLSLIFRWKHTQIARMLQGKFPSISHDPSARKVLDTVEAIFIAELTQRYTEGVPLTPEEFLQWIRDNYSTFPVGRGYVQSFLSRHEEELQVLIAHPLEHLRYDISPSSIDSYYQDLLVNVVGVPTCLVFNCDESGIQEYVDAGPKHVICPTGVSPSNCTYRVKRDGKLVTIMPCISLAGPALTPLCIVKRKTLDANIYDEGLRPNVDVFVQPSNKGYINNETFLKYIDKIFAPSVDEIRAREKLPPTTPAVLMCDNLAAHKTEEVLAVLTKHHIRLVPLPPHGSHCFQPLDLLTFASLKQRIRSTSSRFEKGTQAHSIAVAVSATQDATANHLNVSAFRRAGLGSDMTHTPPVCRLLDDEWQARRKEALHLPPPSS
jgi:hypothetical protein